MALSCPLAHGRRSTVTLRESFLLCVYFKPIFKTWRCAHTHEMCKYNNDSLKTLRVKQKICKAGIGTRVICQRCRIQLRNLSLHGFKAAELMSGSS